MRRVRDVQWKDERGEGSIFFFVDRETGKKISAKLYVSYFTCGKEVVLSAKTADLDDAKRELRRRIRNRENSREGKEILVTPKLERVTVSEILDADLERARRENQASVRQRRYQVEILKNLLGQVRAIEFRPEHVDQYRKRRLTGEGTKRGRKVGLKAVKNELTILSQAFTYARHRGAILSMPFIEKPTINDERKKEIPVEAYYGEEGILAAIDHDDARDFIECMLLSARRPKGIGELRWEWYDAEKGILRVPPEKKGNPTVFSVRGLLKKVFDRRIAARRPGVPYIFHFRGGVATEKSIRRYFYAALEAKEIPTKRAGFTMYDTKKTAMGVMVDAGLTVEEIMAFSGHRNRAMVERYIVRNADRQAKSVDRRDDYLVKRLAQKKAESSRRISEVRTISR
jgi:integrase